MTRTEAITRALRVIGDTSLTTQAGEWLDNICYELESIGYWRFLQTSATYQTVTATSSYTLANFGITNYSKGLSVYTNGGTNADYNQLIQVSKEAFDNMYDGDVSTGQPRFFAFENTSASSGTIYVYPTPTTGYLPLLNVRYFKEITLPTVGTTELSATPGMPKKWHKFMVDGIIAEGMRYTDDPREDKYRALFDRDMMLMIQDNEEFFNIKSAKNDKWSMYKAKPLEQAKEMRG